MLARVAEHKRRKGAQARNPADTSVAVFEIDVHSWLHCLEGAMQSSTLNHSIKSRSASHCERNRAHNYSLHSCSH